MSVVDAGRVEELLVHVERTVHRAGWDRPPIFYTIYDVDAAPHTAALWRRMAPSHRAGEPVRRAGLLAQPQVGADLWPPGRGANDALRAMAGRMTRDAERIAQGGRPPSAAVVLGQVLAQPGLVGAAFLSELWHRSELPEEALARTRAGRRLADTPGAGEARAVWAVDVDGRGYDVMRVRGQAPEARPWSRDDVEADRVVGYVFDSLRAIVAALAGRPRPDLLDPVRMTPEWMTGR